MSSLGSPVLGHRAETEAVLARLGRYCCLLVEKAGYLGEMKPRLPYDNRDNGSRSTAG